MKKRPGRGAFPSCFEWPKLGVGTLAVGADIEALALFLLRNTQARRVLADHQRHVADDGGENDRCQHAINLRRHLRREGILKRLHGGVSGEIVGHAHAANPRIDEVAGEKGTNDTANAVDAKDVQGIVVAKLGLEPNHGPEADHA